MLWIAKNSGPCCIRATWRTVPKPSHRVHRLQLQPPRCFGRTFSQASGEKSFAEDLQYPPLLRPFLFTIAVSGGVLCAAAYVTNRDTEKWTRLLNSTNAWTVFARPPTSEDLRSARHLKMLSEWRNNLNKVKSWLGGSPTYVSELAASTYAMCAQKWCYMVGVANPSPTSPDDQTFYALPIIRVVPYAFDLYLQSQKPVASSVQQSRVQWIRTVLLYFQSEQGRGYSKSLESTSRYHFLSFFVSAGLFSSFLSHAIQVRFYYPRIVSQLSSSGSATIATSAGAALGSAGAQTAAIAPAIVPSLGASGAIWACVSLTALAFPEAQMAFFIPSSISVPIQAGAFGMMALDVIGIIRGWRFFDHWAHLGGAMFGVFYYLYGPNIWETARQHTKPPQAPHMW